MVNGTVCPHKTLKSAVREAVGVIGESATSPQVRDWLAARWPDFARNFPNGSISSAVARAREEFARKGWPSLAQAFEDKTLVGAIREYFDGFGLEGNSAELRKWLGRTYPGLSSVTSQNTLTATMSRTRKDIEHERRVKSIQEAQASTASTVPTLFAVKKLAGSLDMTVEEVHAHLSLVAKLATEHGGLDKLCEAASAVVELSR